jgi:ferredoxin
VAYEVRLDPAECMSSGVCVANQPGAFAFDSDELAVVLPGSAALQDDELLKIARRCPSGAIQLYVGGELVDL